GVPSNKISLGMTGGTLVSKGNGKYTARPAAVGQDVTFTVTGVVNGRSQSMGSFTFKVRKLPDPSPYLVIGNDRFTGGRIVKSRVLGAPSVGAAIDDGLLDIPFRVLSFEAVFFDRMGNIRPEPSAGARFTEAQRELIRSLRRGQRFYISKVRVVGPDGVERTLTYPMEIILN
ncbi:MAG: gliding motility protein GldM, partial [Bacteroidaceae bacterium]|nr:gliding motility protein GldM [Bacteroidaceae bacterium]